MAGDWLKCNFDLWDHRCVQGIAHALSLDADTVVGKLMRLWAWAQKQTTTGRVKPCTVAIIDATARQDGFARALESVGWLEIDDGSVLFVRWDKHNSKGAKERGLAAKRAAKKRHAPVTVASRSRHGASVTKAHLEQSRAEQSGAKAPLERRAEQSQPQSPSAEEAPRPALLGLLESAGLTRFQAIALHAKASAAGKSDDEITHAAARCAEERQSKPIDNPVNYVEVILGVREPARRKLADRRAALAQQAQTARTGDQR